MLRESFYRPLVTTRNTPTWYSQARCFASNSKAGDMARSSNHSPQQHGKPRPSNKHPGMMPSSTSANIEQHYQTTKGNRSSSRNQQLSDSPTNGWPKLSTGRVTATTITFRSKAPHLSSVPEQQQQQRGPMPQ